MLKLGPSASVAVIVPIVVPTMADSVTVLLFVMLSVNSGALSFTSIMKMLTVTKKLNIYIGIIL